jgi:hypothetical protein
MGRGIRGKGPALSVGIGNKFRQTCVTAKNVRSREKNLKLGWCWRCGGLGLCRWMSPGEICSGPWTPGSGLPRSAQNRTRDQEHSRAVRENLTNQFGNRLTCAMVSCEIRIASPATLASLGK